MAIERFNLVLDHAKYLSPSIKHFVFNREDGLPLDFIPGQFVTFLFDVDGSIKRRSYSLSNIPDHSDKIEIAVSYVEGGIASDIFFNMKPGDAYPGMGPAGRLIMKEDNAKRYILVGTGTGIAPYRAMLPTLMERLKTQDNFEVIILFGAQYRKDLLYWDDFKAYSEQSDRFELKACLSRENDLQDLEVKGYVQHQFEILNTNPEEDIFFLCGNPNMIDDAYDDLLNRGFETKAIKREKYISSN